MADKTLQSLVGGGGVKLAPDLTFPETSDLNSQEVTGIDARGGLTTILDLVGKFSISLLEIYSLKGENITVKMTVDDVVIWDASFTCGIACRLLGSQGTASTSDIPITCDESMKLELQTTSDSSCNLRYKVRPIL